MELDAHERPPTTLKVVFKKYQKCSIQDLSKESAVIDIGSDSAEVQSDHVRKLKWREKSTIDAAFTRFICSESPADIPKVISQYAGCVYESVKVPGLLVVPRMIPHEVQRLLLTKIFYRDLSNPSHNTNIDLHYLLERPSEGRCFFGSNKNDLVHPKDPALHKAITYNQLLSKKLRWMTLGGQYDWTRKVYPVEKPPPFPSDLRDLLLGLFPDTDAQAAIVNLYSPGDTLSLHRDVSEECDRGLISVSIGCDCIFVIGFEDDTAPNKTRHAVLRLRSGDAVLMTGRSRYAWHGVPLIIPHTCPEQLRSWPAEASFEDTKMDCEDPSGQWTNWMSSKRINLNVRQMRA